MQPVCFISSGFFISLMLFQAISDILHSTYKYTFFHSLLTFSLRFHKIVALCSHFTKLDCGRWRTSLHRCSLDWIQRIALNSAMMWKVYTFILLSYLTLMPLYKQVWQKAKHKEAVCTLSILSFPSLCALFTPGLHPIIPRYALNWPAPSLSNCLFLKTLFDDHKEEKT